MADVTNPESLAAIAALEARGWVQKPDCGYHSLKGSKYVIEIEDHTHDPGEVTAFVALKRGRVFKEVATIYRKTGVAAAMAAIEAVNVAEANATMKRAARKVRS